MNELERQVREAAHKLSAEERLRLAEELFSGLATGAPPLQTIFGADNDVMQLTEPNDDLTDLLTLDDFAASSSAQRRGLGE